MSMSWLTPTPMMVIGLMAQLIHESNVGFVEQAAQRLVVADEFGAGGEQRRGRGVTGEQEEHAVREQVSSTASGQIVSGQDAGEVVGGHLGAVGQQRVEVGVELVGQSVAGVDGTGLGVEWRRRPSGRRA